MVVTRILWGLAIRFDGCVGYLGVGSGETSLATIKKVLRRSLGPFWVASSRVCTCCNRVLTWSHLELLSYSLSPRMPAPIGASDTKNKERSPEEILKP